MQSLIKSERHVFAESIGQNKMKDDYVIRSQIQFSLLRFRIAHQDVIDRPKKLLHDSILTHIIFTLKDSKIE